MEENLPNVSSLLNMYFQRAVLDDMDDNAIFEELAKKQGKRFETPVGEDITTNRRRVKLASARKTPACYYKEDILESR